MIVKSGKPVNRFAVISGGSILEWTIRRTRSEAEARFCHHRFENKWKHWYDQGFRIKKVKVTIEIV